MSKFFKQFTLKANELDVILSHPQETKTELTRLKGNTSVGTEMKEKTRLESNIESIIFFDKAFSDRSSHTMSSLKMRQKKLEKEKRKLPKVPTGNTRSSTSKYARKAPIPTFNKKKVLAEKKVKDLADIARRLKKDRKARKI